MAKSSKGERSNRAPNDRGFTKLGEGAYVGRDRDREPEKLITLDREARENLIEELRAIDEE